MDARPKTRQVHREKKSPPPQAPRGAKQIVIPMTQEQYEELWPHPDRLRAFVDELARESPELFPQGFERGHAWHGHGRASRKLPGVRLRKVVLAGGAVYWLRPSFVTSDMTGTVEEWAYPLLLATHGVPPWLLTIGFGHNDMSWYRLIERLGRNSLVGTTVRDAARRPEHLAADEHHVDWAGEKGDIATTVGGGCILGVALTKSADDPHLQAAYGEFAAEARDVDPQYAPRTVNTDGWAATRNAFRALFATITLVLCFLHGFLKIRDRCRKHRELHRHVWDVYRAAAAEEFRRLMSEFQQWCGGQTWTAPVREMLTKLWNKTEPYAVAYAHPGCHRTSNAVDRPMNRLARLLYAGRGLHGRQCSSELRLRGGALLLNFRPFARRSHGPRAQDSPAHRLNGKRRAIAPEFIRRKGL
ncbi:MAG: hypothetical protein ACREJB_10210 [Planctomycetaceae bacterium]